MRRTNHERQSLESEVIAIYRKVVASSSDNTTFSQLCQRVADHPASRFYFNKRYAIKYCIARERGEMPVIKRSYHRSLLEAFYDLLLIELLNASRYDNLKRVISRTMSRPAPCLGLSPRVIQRIIQSKLHIHTSRNAKQ